MTWQKSIFMLCLGIGIIISIVRLIPMKPIKSYVVQSMVQLSGSEAASDPWVNMTDSYIRSLVVVTGVSDNHYNEAIKMIASVHRFLPDNKIIIYDIGLKTDQIDLFKKEKHVEIRYHNFSAYPRFNDQNYLGLGCYSFKPQIIREVMKEYNVVAWLDASIRLLKPPHACMEHLDVEPLTVCNPHLPEYRAVQFARDAMLNYFNIKRENWGSVIGYQSGCIFFRMTPKLRPILDAWYECSLHRECMCGGDIKPRRKREPRCKLINENQSTDGINKTNFIGCHRYDQAALDFIVGKELGIEKVDSLVHEECTNSNAIQRWSR